MRIQLRVYIKEWNTYKTYLTYDDVKNFIHQAKKMVIFSPVFQSFTRLFCLFNTFFCSKFIPMQSLIQIFINTCSIFKTPAILIFSLRYIFIV